MAGVRNVTEVLQMWTVALENVITLTLAVVLNSTVNALCHLIYTKILKSA
jgi:hypothetical protein